MTALDLFEAIGNMNDESIRLCLPDETEPEWIAEDGMQCNPPPVKQKTAKQGKTNFPAITLLPYLMTAGCTAACIAGMVLLIKFAAYNDDFSVQSGNDYSAVTEVISAITQATSTENETAETNTTVFTVITEQTARMTEHTERIIPDQHFTQSPEKAVQTVVNTTAQTVSLTFLATTQTQTTVTDASPYQKPDAAGLFEKYAFDFPVYQIDGGYAVSIDNENIHCYDLNGNEIDCRWSNCRIFDNPYRYSEFHAEEDVSINPYDFIYTCNCENGIYYAVLDNGTAIIAGADRAWLDENKPETLVIPEEINGFRVTEIASRAFDSIGMKCESLHEIRIADTVEIIHPYAFENAFLNRAGAKINIPANVKTICRRAFSGNNDAVGEKYVGKEKADRVIILPDSLEYLQADAFTSETRYIFKMPESPVLSDSILIGSNRSVESADLSQYPDNYFEKYYVDGNFNVVTFRDAVQYFSAKETQ